MKLDLALTGTPPGDIRPWSFNIGGFQRIGDVNGIHFMVGGDWTMNERKANY